MSSSAFAECTETVGMFLKEKLVAPLQSASTSTPSGFDGVEFSRPPSLREFCATSSHSHVRSIDSPAKQKIVKLAYDELRSLYDSHLEKVVQLFQLAFHLDTTGYQKDPRIVLNNIFVTHPQGAHVALEEIIAKGRALLSKHYLQVERIYQGTIQKLSTV